MSNVMFVGCRYLTSNSICTFKATEGHNNDFNAGIGPCGTFFNDSTHNNLYTPEKLRAGPWVFKFGLLLFARGRLKI